jgi:hypothetical protein
VHDGPCKRGRKPLDEPYVDTRMLEEKMAAWHFACAVAFRYTVNAHTTVWACHHNVGGIDVLPPVMQLCPWGNEVAQFVTIDEAWLEGTGQHTWCACWWSQCHWVWQAGTIHD